MCDHKTFSEELKSAFQGMVEGFAAEPLQVGFPGLKCRPYTVAQWNSVKELADMVDGQYSFAQKMCNKLWLRSPALNGTLRRALVRYERYLRLFKLRPGLNLVSALDIDLVQRTHQCSASSYEAACLELCGKSIEQESAVSKESLKNDFAETCRLYEAEFKDEYNGCTCWECEAVRSALATVDFQGDVDYNAIVESVHDDVLYHRAVEYIRRKKVPSGLSPN
jgi:hypothetical protein